MELPSGQVPMDVVELLGKARSLAAVDTNASIFRCRQFAEALTRALADKTGADVTGMPFIEQIKVVAGAARLPPRVVRALHNVRIAGNQAAHHHLSGDDEAQATLALCEEILAETQHLLPPGVAVASTAEVPSAITEPEDNEDVGALIDAIKTLRHQAQQHRLKGLAVPAVVSFEMIQPDLLMALTTSGVPRAVLEEARLIRAQVPGEPVDLRKIGSLGELGFRLCGDGNSVVKLIVPPTERPAADLGLSPLGDAYLSALCSASYMEGRMARSDLLKHIKRAFVRAREARLSHPEWPDSIMYRDLARATRAAFQFPGGQRSFLIAPRGNYRTPWKQFSQETPGWVARDKFAQVT